MNEKIKQNLENDILEILSQWDDDERLMNWKTGSSVSTVLELLRDKGWKNLGNIADFEYTLNRLGFSTVPAKTKTGFHKWNRVVTI